VSIFLNEAVKSLRKGYTLTATLSDDYNHIAERDKQPYEFWLMVGFYLFVWAVGAVAAVLYMFGVID
jgi:hypothetical protein